MSSTIRPEMLKTKQEINDYLSSGVFISLTARNKLIEKRNNLPEDKPQKQIKNEKKLNDDAMSKNKLNVDSMTISEINAILGSKKFINSSTVNLLKLKLAELMSKPLSMDDFFSILSNGTADYKPKPQTVPVYDDFVDLNLSSSNKKTSENTISYTKLMDSYKNVNTRCIFFDEKIQINYSYIEEIYKQSAVYRLRLKYMINKKQIEFMNAFNSTYDENRFKYLCSEDVKLKSAISFYGLFSEIYLFLKKYNYQTLIQCLKGNIMVSSNHIYNILNYLDDIDENKYYYKLYENKHMQIKKDLINSKLKKPILADEINSLNQLFLKDECQINCYHYISIKNTDENPITLIAVGYMSVMIYVDDEFDYDEYEFEFDIENSETSFKHDNGGWENSIRIYKQSEDIILYYYIDDTIPFKQDKIDVHIESLNNEKIIACQFKNRQNIIEEEPTKHIILSKPEKKQIQWFFSSNKYEILTDNKYYVEALFMNAFKHNNNGDNIVNVYMYEAFITLIFNTSTNNNNLKNKLKCEYTNCNEDDEIYKILDDIKIIYEDVICAFRNGDLKIFSPYIANLMTLNDFTNWIINNNFVINKMFNN
jgi:hypothetical protein